MKNKKEFKNYGKGILSFGKHKGKTIKEVIKEGDYGYIIWLNDNVSSITISGIDLALCKDRNQKYNSLCDATECDIY